LEITPSGTLRVKPEYYQRLGQMQYPKTIPPSAIKFVWVRKNDFPNAKGEENTFSIKHLPGEARDIVDELEGIYNGVADTLEKIETDFEGKMADNDFEYWIEELQDYIKKIKQYEDDSDVIGSLENIIQSLEEREKIDLEKETQQARDFADYARNEKWGSSLEYGQTDWVKVPAEVAKRGIK
jgi:hypothetical protein